MSERENTRPVSVQLLGGLAASLITTLLAVLVFAVIILVFDFGSAVITAVNQVIKVISILCGTLIASRRMKGWKAGLCVGAAYMTLGVILYCAFSGELLPVAAIAGDMALGCASGLLCGMLAGTMKR